ncbi:MAG: HDOD domain-containing protein [Thermogutta sp.]
MSRTEVIHSEAAERLAALAGNLYTLPAVALEILHLVDQVDTDAVALRHCVEKDPALAAKILRVVNSSLYGPSQPIGDLGQALAFLGAKPLKLLVLGFSLPTRMFQGIEAKVLAYYWRHTLTKSIAARELAEELVRTSSEECFLGGLLQDIGLLVFIQSLGTPFQRFVEKVADKQEDLYAREREVFGFDHRVISAKLLRHWGMPRAIVEIIDASESTNTLRGAKVSLPRKILYGAEVAASILADQRPDGWAAWEEIVGQLRGRNTTPTSKELLRQIHEKTGQLAEILSLRLPPGESYEKIVATAHEKLAKVSEDVAGLMLSGKNSQNSRATGRHLEESKEVEELHRTLMSCLESPLWAGFNAADQNMTQGATAFSCVQQRPPAAQLGAGQGPLSRNSTHKSKVVRENTEKLADPGLLGRLRTTVAWCRAKRCGVSLLLIDYHDISNLFLLLGKERFPRLQEFLMASCISLEHPDSTCCPYGDTGCAWILPDCERETAVLYGQQLIEAIKALPLSGHSGLAVVAAVGIAYVATPAPNFPAEDLLSAAQRCLFGSLASGGGVVKSIEIY